MTERRHRAEEAALGATNDFSSIAARYDATRGIPEPLLASCFERLVEAAALPPSGFVLDGGCGTGQISLPLAARGYEICGFDVSLAMVRVARSKCRAGWSARYSVADVRSLPVKDGACDAVIVSKLFQHVGNWQIACRELLRVLRPGACLIQVNERGAFGNAVRKHFAARAEKLGFTQRFPGLSPAADLGEFMLAEACERAPADLSVLRWEKCVSHGDALSELEEGLFAEFWRIPGESYAGILADTARWIDRQPHGRGTVERMQPYLSAAVFRKVGR